MKFVISYRHEHNTKSLSTGIVCVEAESAEQIRAELREVVQANASQESFSFQGYTLDTRDFCEFVSEPQFAHFEAMARRLKRAAPSTFDVYGRRHRFTRVDVFTLDEWFDQHRKTADSVGG